MGILTTEHMFAIVLSLLLDVRFTWRITGMDFKALIVEMLDRASAAQLRRLYHFIKSYLG